MLTLPLYIFITLPPIEIVNEIPQTQVVQVPTNITTTTITTRNVTFNVTQGSSVFLSKQAPPPVIDSDIVIALDTSQSMNTGTRLADAKAAINNLISVLNQSQKIQNSHDRIGLVSFSGNTGDTLWNDDAYYETGLDYVSNQTHLNDLRSKTNSILAGSAGKTGQYTDIWAGLNFSLQLLLNNPRNSPSLQSIILLTDGAHTRGPFYTDVGSPNFNYTGFLSLNSSFSSNPYTPNSESPVAVARSHGIKIHTIGLYDQAGVTDLDPNFLQNISKNLDYGTFGEYFDGNNQLSISESFLQARDSASGWVKLVSSDINVTNTGTNQLYTYNVTDNQRRLKWDVNLENKSVLVDASLTDPNGTVISLANFIPDNFNLISNQTPLSVIIDFPETGLWKFNISLSNLSSQERVLSRLSSYQPPVFIDGVSQLNTTNLNKTSGATSLTFDMNVTNKNSLFSFHNIKPILMADFSAFNYTAVWSPSSVSEIPYNSSTSFELNITFLEAVQIQGSFLMMVNSSEGYYDAYAQPLSLDSRTTISNTTIENVVQTQTVVSTAFSTSTGYNYDRQVLTQVNYIAFALTFLLLFGITFLYIRSKEESLRKLASQLKGSFLRDRSSIEAGLANLGIDTSALSMDQLLEQISSLDDLGTAIGNQIGSNLSTEDLIKVASGITTDKIASRLSNNTGQSLNDILDLIANAGSIDEISKKLNMSYDDFMFIITPDEQVDKFQKLMKSLVKPLGVPVSSRMFIQEPNFDDFRRKMKKTQQ